MMGIRQEANAFHFSLSSLRWNWSPLPFSPYLVYLLSLSLSFYSNLLSHGRLPTHSVCLRWIEPTSLLLHVHYNCLWVWPRHANKARHKCIESQSVYRIAACCCRWYCFTSLLRQPASQCVYMHGGAPCNDARLTFSHIAMCWFLCTESLCENVGVSETVRWWYIDRQ